MNILGHKRSNWRVSDDHADLSRQPLVPHPIRIDGRTKKLTVDMAHCALMIVDMQNDFCTPSGWLDYIGVDVTNTRSPVDPLNRLLPKLRERNIPIIWVNWGNRPDKLNISPSILHVYNPNGKDVGLCDPLPNNQSRVLEKGSWGSAIVSELEVTDSDIQIDKYRMSGFWDTPLDSILRNLRINTLFFAGVNLDQCVMATLQDAVNLGYDSILLDDCSATTSPSYCKDATIYNINQCYGFVTDSISLIHGLSEDLNEDNS